MWWLKVSGNQNKIGKEEREVVNGKRFSDKDVPAMRQYLFLDLHEGGVRIYDMRFQSNKAGMTGQGEISEFIGEEIRGTVQRSEGRTEPENYGHF